MYLIVLIVSQIRVVVVVVVLMMILSRVSGLFATQPINRAGDIVVQHLRLLGAQTQWEGKVLRQLMHDLARSDQSTEALLQKEREGERKGMRESVNLLVSDQTYLMGKGVAGAHGTTSATRGRSTTHIAGDA